MAPHLFAASIITLFTIVIHSDARIQDKGKGLHVGFYSSRCPKVEDIVSEVVAEAHKADPKLSPSLIRLFFHDCFVKGCDASILLDSTPSGEPIEKVAIGNAVTLRGYDVLDRIKARVEQVCPRTVSCADIIAFAAREAVNLTGLPRHKVPAGRRDSLTSRASDVDFMLDSPTTPVPDMIRSFARRGLTVEDMVVLSGAHSLGQAQCWVFRDRLYRYSKDVIRDPSLNPIYAQELAGKCPANEDRAKLTLVNFDPVTPLKLDNQYYTNLLEGRGLLQSDQVLSKDPRTEAIVKRMAASQETWTRKFLKAMIKMGRAHVLTKTEGQVRINCRAFL